MFIQRFLFRLLDNLFLFFDMALLQRVKRFQFALRCVKFVTSSLGGYLAVLDQFGLLSDCLIEFIDKLLEITQLCLIHAIPRGFMQAGLIVLAEFQQSVELLLRALLLFVQQAELARCRIIPVFRQIHQGLQREWLGHVSCYGAGENNALSCAMLAW